MIHFGKPGFDPRQMLRAEETLSAAQAKFADAERRAAKAKESLQRAGKTWANALGTLSDQKVLQVIQEWRDHVEDVDRRNEEAWWQYEKEVMECTRNRTPVPDALIMPLAVLPDEKLLSEFKTVVGGVMAAKVSFAEAIKADHACSRDVAEAQVELTEAEAAFCAAVEKFPADERRFGLNIAKLRQYASEAKEAHRDLLAKRKADVAELEKGLSQ